DQDVFQLDGVVALDGHALGPGVGLELGQGDLPVALVVGPGGGFLAGEGHGDGLVLVGPTPDDDGLVALDDHVAGEDGRQLDVGGGAGWQQQYHGGAGEQQSTFHGRTGL